MIIPSFRFMELSKSINKDMNNENEKFDSETLKEILTDPKCSDSTTLLVLNYINSLKVHDQIPYCESIMPSLILKILNDR